MCLLKPVRVESGTGWTGQEVVGVAGDCRVAANGEELPPPG